jgi:FAD/FMN-containing dehydrogenase
VDGVIPERGDGAERGDTLSVADLNLSKLVRSSVHYAGIGHAGDDDTRQIHPLVLNHGYGAYDEAAVAPAVKAGCTRFVLHDPGGFKQNAYFEFDELVEAERLGLISTQDFVSTFGNYRRMGVEGIAYLGCMAEEHNPRFIELSQAGRIAYAMIAVAPVIQAELSVWFDASADYAADSWEMEVVRLIQAAIRPYGGRIYAEHAGAARHPHFAGVGVWAQHDQLQYVPPLSERHGNEVICHVGPQNPGEEETSESARKWMPRELSRMRGLGYTPMGNLGYLV